MHYYSFQAILFNDNERDPISLVYKSETPANISEFKKHVEELYADTREYNAIVISGWKEIFESTYNIVGALLVKL